MKNTIKLLSIIAMLAVITFSMTACGDPGSDGVPKYFEITGIPVSGGTNLTGKYITIGISGVKAGQAKIFAVGQGIINGATFKILLRSNADDKKGQPYDGTGPVDVYMFVDGDGLLTPGNYDVYIYSGGGNDVNGVPYDIQDETSTLRWADFIKK